jgi:undecaprenyl-diphosphatase
LWFFRADWIRIITGFLRSLRRSLRDRQLSVRGSDERLAWLIVLATIPVGLTGLIFEHSFRTVFAKPVAASVFLLINGLILLAGERARRRIAPVQAGVPARAQMPIAGGSPEADADPDAGALHAARRGARSVDELAVAYQSDVRISRISYRDSLYVGSLQILALFAGISRSGVTMVGGLWRGLDHEDAARFAFLLATPVILAAGVLKLPSLAGHESDHRLAGRQRRRRRIRPDGPRCPASGRQRAGHALRRGAWRGSDRGHARDAARAHSSRPGSRALSSCRP